MNAMIATATRTRAVKHFTGSQEQSKKKKFRCSLCKNGEKMRFKINRTDYRNT